MLGSIPHLQHVWKRKEGSNKDLKRGRRAKEMILEALLFPSPLRNNVKVAFVRMRNGRTQLEVILARDHWV